MANLRAEKRINTGLVAGTLLALLFATPFAMAEAPAPEIDAYWPAWLKDAMRRESREKPRIELRLGEGQIITKVAGELLAGPEPMETGWFVSINFGAIEPMECWIYNESQYLATLVESIRQVRTDEIQALYGDAPYKHNTVYYTDAGAYKDVPYVTTERMYLLQTAPQTTLGMLKIRAAEKDGATFLCAHHELGYRKSFARTFRRLVTSADVTIPSMTPYYRDVIQLEMNDRPVGVRTRVFAQDEDGDTLIQTSTAMVIQTGDSAVATSDTTRLEFSAPDGKLINAFQTHIEDGDIVFDLALEANEDGVWTVTGEHAGETVEQEIDTDASPVSTLGQALTIAGVVGSRDRARDEMWLWLPESDPVALTQGSFNIEKRRRSKSTGRLVLGPRTMAATVDSRGALLEAAYRRAGDNEMRLERVFDDGRIQTPKQ